MEGKVKWFSEEKGFGFITGHDGIDRYVGARDIKGATLPNNGSLVEFEHTEAAKGPKAINVQIKEKGEGIQNERVTCPSCNKTMIPRLYGNPPKESRCPFCGNVYKKFPLSTGELIILITFIVGLLIFFLLVIDRILN